jgi:hypothetical protein
VYMSTVLGPLPVPERGRVKSQRNLDSAGTPQALHPGPCHAPLYLPCICGGSAPDHLARNVRVTSDDLAGQPFGRVTDVRAPKNPDGFPRGAVLYQVAWEFGPKLWHTAEHLRILRG